jgi:conjugative transfer region protein (TIGR03750 family)
MSGTFFDDDGGATAADVDAPLTDRVNSEPPIMKGLSATETLYAMLVAFPLWTLIGAILAVIVSHWQILMICGVIGPMVSVWFGAGFLASFKRNRPDHYYLHAFIRWRHRLGLGRSPFVVRSGGWDLGRSMPLIPSARQSLTTRLVLALNG